MSYPYKAYFETLLSYNDAAKKSYLRTSLFEEDGLGHAKIVKHTEGTKDSGYSKRKEWIKNGKTCHFSSMIHCDIFSIKKYLIPEVSIKIDLQRAKENFFLLAESKYKDHFEMELIDLKLHLRTVKVSKDLDDFISNAIDGGRKAQYSFIESGVSFNSIGLGLLQTEIHSIYQGILPLTIFCCLVNNSAIDGEISENPWCFENKGVKSFQFIGKTNICNSLRYMLESTSDLTVFTDH